jgi:hypothetical protein
LSIHITDKSDNEEDVVVKDIDIFVGMVCLICKRQFQSEEVLKKHMAQSELHKVLKNSEKKEKCHKGRRFATISFLLLLFFPLVTSDEHGAAQTKTPRPSKGTGCN